jgi:allantoinase
VHDLVIRGSPDDVAVTDGVIAAIGPGLDAGAEEIDATGLLVLPGVVDVHVHLNDPGRADWEGFATGTRALAAGGATCAADMPLNSAPPTIDADGFAAKVAAALGRAHVDVALWGGLVPGDLDRLDALAGLGVIGFKAFMCETGIDDFVRADDDVLAAGMARAARLGLPVAVHAEDQDVVGPLAADAIAHGRTGMRDYLASRPARAEVAAVRTALTIAAETGCALHVVHVSCGESARLVAEARAQGVDATCEVCPHHLVLDENDAEAIGALAKCGPPLRSASEIEDLWRALEAGEIGSIASDHSPAPPDMKRGDDMFAVWGGIAGAQTTLALTLTHGLARGIAAARLATWLSTAPAERFGLAGKGRLEVGADADIVLVATDAPWTLRTEDLEYRHRVSPFAGRTLTARPVRTILRGRTVALDGRPVGEPRGRFIHPGDGSGRCVF